MSEMSESTNDEDKSFANAASRYDEESSEGAAVDKVSASDQGAGLPAELPPELPSREQSVDFDADPHPRLDLDSPLTKSASPAGQPEDGAFGAAPAPDVDDEECAQLLHQLDEERNLALQRNVQMQMTLAEHFRRKGGQLQTELQDYDEGMSVLMDLKRHLIANSAAARRQEEELGIQVQEELGKVENEWQALLSRKRDVGLSLLRRRLDKQAAEARLEPALAAERLRHHELAKLRLQNIKLEMAIRELERLLCITDERGRNPLQVQFEQLQAKRQEFRKKLEKHSEDTSKLLREASSSSELLSSVKEKLERGQRELQDKQEHLSNLEAEVFRKRDALAGIKQVCNTLHRDNLKLKESRGLLGSRALLQVFEDTADAAELLEAKLEYLRCRLAEVNLGCEQYKKKQEGKNVQ